MSNLAYEDSDEDDVEEDDEDLIPRDDPLWDIYLTVRNYTTHGGAELAEAFVTLPSRLTPFFVVLFFSHKDLGMGLRDE